MAIGEYTKAIELNPDFTFAYFERAYSYNKLGQNQNAINDYTKAIQLDPDHAFAYGNRGVAYFSLDQYQLSIDDMTKAIQQEPSALRHNYRAWSYYYLGEYTKMEADNAAACSLDSAYC